MFGIRKVGADEAGPARHTHWKKKKEGKSNGPGYLAHPARVDAERRILQI
jgi:hypothetical protein